MATKERSSATRTVWLETLAKHRHNFEEPGSRDYWSPQLDTASRDEIIAIQNEKLARGSPVSLREQSILQGTL